MATLTIEKGAIPQVEQKQITNYVYNETGGETRDVTYQFTENENTFTPYKYGIPNIIAEDGRVNAVMDGSPYPPAYYDENGTFSSHQRNYPSSQTLNGGTPYEIVVNTMPRVGLYYDRNISGQTFGYVPSPEFDPENLYIPTGGSIGGWTGTSPTSFRAVLTTGADGELDWNAVAYDILPDKIKVSWYFDIYEKHIYYDSQGREKYYWEKSGSTSSSHDYEATAAKPALLFWNYYSNYIIEKDHTAYNCELTLQEVVT